MGAWASVEKAASPTPTRLSPAKCDFAELLRASDLTGFLLGLERPCFPRELCGLIAAFFSALPGDSWTVELPAATDDHAVPRNSSLVWDPVIQKLIWCRRFPEITLKGSPSEQLLETVVIDFPTRTFAARATPRGASDAWANSNAVWFRGRMRGVARRGLHFSSTGGETTESFVSDQVAILGCAFSNHVGKPSDTYCGFGPATLNAQGLHVLHALGLGNFQWVMFSKVSAKSGRTIGKWKLDSSFGTRTPLAVRSADEERMLCTHSGAGDLVLLTEHVSLPWLILSRPALEKVCGVGTGALQVSGIAFDAEGNLWVHALDTQLVCVSRPSATTFQAMRDRNASWSARKLPSVDAWLPAPLDADTIFAFAENTLVFARHDSLTGVPVASILQDVTQS